MKLIEHGPIPRDESIVVCITGNGYKTVGGDGVAAWRAGRARPRASRSSTPSCSGGTRPRSPQERGTRTRLFDDVLVQKYGGSSVATAEKILASPAASETRSKRSAHLVVAVSAMGKTTDQLIAMAASGVAAARAAAIGSAARLGRAGRRLDAGLALQARACPPIVADRRPVQHPHRRLVQQGAHPAIDTARIEAGAARRAAS